MSLGITSQFPNFQNNLSVIDQFLFHLLRILISLFLYLCVGSLPSLVYVFISITMSGIFFLNLVVFMITVAVPLSAGSMMMEMSFLSCCGAAISHLLMLH